MGGDIVAGWVAGSRTAHVQLRYIKGPTANPPPPNGLSWAGCGPLPHTRACVPACLHARAYLHAQRPHARTRARMHACGRGSFPARPACAAPYGARPRRRMARRTRNSLLGAPASLFAPHRQPPSQPQVGLTYLNHAPLGPLRVRAVMNAGDGRRPMRPAGMYVAG